MNLAIATGLIDVGKSLIKKWFPDPEEADKREKELQALILSGDMKELEIMASIITTESKSEHFLVAAWRPITMLVFVFIIANNYILYPYLSLFFNEAPKLEIPPDMWDLLKIGLGGYTVGRTVEKSVKAYAKK